jgi:hypothetical protein
MGVHVWIYINSRYILHKYMSLYNNAISQMDVTHKKKEKKTLIQIKKYKRWDSDTLNKRWLFDQQSPPLAKLYFSICLHTKKKETSFRCFFSLFLLFILCFSQSQNVSWSTHLGVWHAPCQHIYPRYLISLATLPQNQQMIILISWKPPVAKTMFSG